MMRAPALAHVRARLSVLPAALLLALLAACGGGGTGSTSGSSDATGTTAQTPAPGTTGGTTGATTSGTTAGTSANPTSAGAPVAPWYAAALQRINEMRALAGLGTLVRSSTLDTMAQGHADWMQRNATVAHVQVAGSPGFTGIDTLARATAAGYDGVASESIGGLSSWVFDSDAVGAARLVVEYNIKAAYHRSVLLSPDPLDVGLGSARIGSGAGMDYLVMNLGVRRGAAASGGDTVVVWPRPQASDVPLDNGSEFPSPVSGIDSRLLGHAASVHCARTKTLDVTRFVIVEAGSGAAVDVAVATSGSDPYLTPCSAIAVPRTFLKAGTDYRAEFDGFVAGVRTTRTWSFRTAPP